jgi:RNA polymerase sigma-70 factor (ECF subfamily)
MQVSDQEKLAADFQPLRPYLLRVAYSHLGSLAEAEDIVQEAWLRLVRSDREEIRDVRAWLTTVVSRLAIDALTSARARRETYTGEWVPDPVVAPVDAPGPEEQALLADSLGLSLLIVLESLSPAERSAFVLHDVFDVPFEEIAPLIDRSEPAARQLASRARRRVSATPTPDRDLAGQWEVVDAFLAAARDGDFEALLTMLDPDVVRRADIGTAGLDVPRILRGPQDVLASALAFQTLGYNVRRAVVNGAPGLVAFDGEEPRAVLGYTIARGKIVEMNVLADPARLRRLDLTALKG